MCIRDRALEAGAPPAVRAALLPRLPRAAALEAMLQKGAYCPRASSVGRLFDGVYAPVSYTHLDVYKRQA